MTALAHGGRHLLRRRGRFSLSSRRTAIEIVACDTVIFAVGQIADLLPRPGPRAEVTPRNTIVVADTMQTSDPRVFAGGDVAFGPRIVIEAVDGRRAARIDTLLTGRQDEAQDIHVKIFDSLRLRPSLRGGRLRAPGSPRAPRDQPRAARSGVEVEEVLTARAGAA
ncbi:MAG: FAD-dependent oxidoreductase [Polyangiaceae bacterium]